MKLIIVLSAFLACCLANPARPSPWDRFFAFPFADLETSSVSGSGSESGSGDSSSESTSAPSDADDSSEESSPLGLLPFSIFRMPFFNPEIFRIPKFPRPENNADTIKNSTSEIKVINGHKVQVNTTEYKSANNGRFVARTVIVRSFPEKDPSTEEVESLPSPKHEITNTKTSDENEIGAEQVADPDPQDNLEA